MEVFFLLLKMPRFLLMTKVIICISKNFVTIVFSAIKTWHFNFLASKRSYSFKKIISMRRWQCIVYTFFLLPIQNISNRWWRQCTEANEWNNLRDQLTIKTTCCDIDSLLQFTFKILCYEYIYAMLWIKSQFYKIWFTY